ncbi:EAL domain-containing protein [Blautia sp.]|uniref:EAL domain-containing protein n=1 Tax=Blautia sp. TaxID=1955243 RepID=UPI0035220121
MYENVTVHSLAKGRERISLNYRTLIKQEYRWVCMEVIRSAEYKPDAQIAMMYIRDINDEYLKHLDKIIRHAKDAFASVIVNISDGSCIMANSRIVSLELKDVNEPLDSYIERISQSIPQREVRTQYRKVFCVDNLRECLAQGKDMIQWECPVYAAKGISLRMIRTTVEMVRNVSYDRLEALIYFSDITENYFSEQIPHMLYRKNFDRIEIIERYSFSVHQFNKEGEKCLKNYTFFYFNKFFDTIVATVEDITEKFEQDILTGGYNRQGFIRHVERILKESEDRTGYAVVFFDIKNFKAVNELFGTEIGDMMLRKVYEDVRKSELKPLVSAREDADHFICLVERKNLNLDMLTGMCQKKLTRGGKTLHLSVKCGIFMLEKKKMSVNGMIDRAKIAQRYITDEFVQSYKIYDSSMKNTYIDKATLAGELEEGIAKGQFKVYFQPVVDAKTGKIASAESLIRWFHPKKGFISPGVFIPALEDSGHISELDLYVLDSVNKFQKKCYQSDKITVPVSTNLSWMDFYDETIMNWLEKKCADVSMPSGLCRMEITETSYAAIEADRNATLEALREAGVLLLLDDFGSGYFSFGMLQNYNFDIIKIDMSFVRQIETNTKTRSIIRFIIE